MTKRGNTWGLLLLSCLAMGAPRAVMAEGRPVATVLTVKVKGDRDVYLQKVKKLVALSEKLQSGGTIRVWRATLAGPDSGLIFAVIEYANMEAMAKGVTKMQNDDDWKKLIKEVDQSNIRDVVSNELLEEITP